MAKQPDLLTEVRMDVKDLARKVQQALQVLEDYPETKNRLRSLEDWRTATNGRIWGVSFVVSLVIAFIGWLFKL